MAVIAKAACPRCCKSVAVMRWEGKTPVPFHQDEDGKWCSGTRKSREELVVDFAYALMAERDALREYSDELLRHSENVVALMDKHVACQEVVTAISKQITDVVLAARA